MTKPATPLYSKEELAWFRENWAETEFLVHVVGSDDVLLYSDDRDGFDPGGEHVGTVPHTLETADKAAAAINATYAYTQAHNPSEFDPFFHATVFHYGRPLAAPEDIPTAPAFSAEDLAWFKETWGNTEWVAYVHGQDECFDRRNEGDPLFTEETIRKYVTDMAVLDRRMTYEGYTALMAVSVFHFGKPTPTTAPVVDATAEAVNAR